MLCKGEVMKLRASLFFGLVVVSGAAGAIVLGGSNLGIFGYPDPKCHKPYRPYDLSDRFAVDRYNSEARIYRDCVIEYLENAEHDIERIQEKMRDVVSEAQR